MRKLKVGVIGVGMAFERLHYPAYQKLAEKYEIVALCDVDTEKCRRWAKIILKTAVPHAQDGDMRDLSLNNL